MTHTRALRSIGIVAALVASVAALPTHARARLASPVTAFLAPDSISGVVGQRKTVVLRADMGSTGYALGSYAVSITWDSTLVRLDSVGSTADFATPTVRYVNGSEVVISGASGSGFAGSFSLATLYFHIVFENGEYTRATIDPTFSEFTSADFIDLKPGLVTTGAVARVLAPSVLVGFSPDSILQRVGFKPEIDLTADLTSDPDVALGSYTADISWDASVMRLDSVRAGNVGVPEVNQLSTGSIRITAADAVGATGMVTAARLYFRFINATYPSETALSLSVSELHAAQSFGDLLPGMTSHDGKALIGGWLRGDVDVTDAIVSNDALKILKLTVGLPVAGITGNGVPQGDADCNGSISAKDAAIVLNYIVGNTVAFCVGTIQ